MSSPPKRPVSPRKVFSPSSWSSGSVLEEEVEPAVGPQGVVAGPHQHVLGIGDRPAREGSGAVLDVVLRVVADAHGEELQQLAAVVLVDRVLVVLAVVQPQDHRRVAGQGDEQVGEVALAEAAEHLDLVHQRPALRQLGVAGREDVVPEERHLLLQRVGAGHHTQQPVGLEAGHAETAGVVGVVAADYVVVDPAARGPAQQRLDGGLVALLGVTLQLRARGPEARPAHQVRDQRDVFPCHFCLLPAAESIENDTMLLKRGKSVKVLKPSGRC